MSWHAALREFLLIAIPLVLLALINQFGDSAPGDKA
jgi:hypothetical protein